MADTSFVSQITTIAAAWLNQANKLVFWGRRPNVATTTGSANAQILTLETGSLYSAGTEADGDEFVFLAGFTNAAAMTLQVLQPSGTNVARAVQLNGVALTGGEVIAGQPYRVTRKSTTWQLTSLAGTAVGTSILQAATTAAVRTAINAMENVFTTRADLVRGGVGGIPERFAPSVAGQAAIFDGLDTVFGTPSVVTVRQTQRLGPVDSSGYNATLSAGAGLNFNVDASPTAVVLDFAAGSVDYTATITADASDQGSLAASNTNFIHATYVSPTSVTWSNCLVPPQYGYAFDRSCNLLCRWPGADAATSTTEDFGHSITLVGNAQVDTGITIRGSNVLLLDGTGDYATIPSTLTRVGQDGSSWEIEFDFRSASLPGGGASQQILHLYNGSGYGVYLDLYNNGAGSTYLRFSASANGSAWDIASNAAGAKTTGWATGTNYTGRLAFDALVGTYKLYLSIAGAAESADISVSSSSRVCALTGGRIGADNTGTFFWNGSIGTFAIRPCVSRTSTTTPSASAPTITDYPVHFFSIPKMTMYEVTAASASAGTDPTMTAKNRVFVGEQDTNASAVTATRNYSLLGRYQSTDTAIPSSSTTTNFNANIGVPTHLTQCRAVAVNATATLGYKPGETADLVVGGYYAPPYTMFGALCQAQSRTSVAFIHPSTAGGGDALMIVNKSSYQTGSIASADTKWRLRVLAERTF